VSFTCPEGTFSPTPPRPAPTEGPIAEYRPSPPSGSRVTPTGPTAPTPSSPNSTMYFTLPLQSVRFSEEVKERFLASVHEFFLWEPGTATLSGFGPDPDDENSMVVQVVTNTRDANLAYSKWGSSSISQKLALSPNVMYLSPHEPHKRCAPVDCQSSSLRIAEWDTHMCSCAHFLTGSGTFVYIILPILLFCLLALLLCCWCPMCPLYNKWRRQQGHHKVAVDDIRTQVNMMPRGVADSEESMRGEGQPLGDTEDPPAERRAWDDEDRRRGSALIRASETEEEPIRLGRPRSDDSDDDAAH
jgi:hypothetical protein